MDEETTGQRPVAAAAPETEAELDQFRKQWREEVSARNKKPAESLSTRVQTKRLQRSQGAPPPAHATGSFSAWKQDNLNEELAPNAYHDIPDKEEQSKLANDGQNHDRVSLFREPSSALEHYERAVERESQGNLSESIRHYRKAFKLDDGVHEAYKRKHFPPSAFSKSKPANLNPSNTAATVPRTDHHSLRSDGLPPTLKQLVDDFADLRIEAAKPATSASPQERCLLAELPEEILTNVLTQVAMRDVSTFVRLTQVCKRLAFLVLTEESIWKRIATGQEFGFAAMHYNYAVDIDGMPLTVNDEIARYLDEDQTPSEMIRLPTADERAMSSAALMEQLLHSHYQSSYRAMFRSRPRLRFNGCYISTVNYTRAGATSSNTLTWGAPVHVVTYFRYLRFFRDGSVISLLSTAEPADVVHHLIAENVHTHHTSSLLPSSVMKDALRGRWRLSSIEEDGAEGDVFVETEGVVSKYTYKMHLTLAHAGKGARNNKLAWKGFWSWNRLTDDWGEFGLRNDRAFYWSRVRSYGMGYC